MAMFGDGGDDGFDPSERIGGLDEFGMLKRTVPPAVAAVAAVAGVGGWGGGGGGRCTPRVACKGVLDPDHGHAGGELQQPPGGAGRAAC